MKIIFAPDKFKGSLTSVDAALAMEAGFLQFDPNLDTRIFPIADGGEGTADILTFHSKGTINRTSVNGPLFRPVTASYGISTDGKTAFVDMASASGLALLSPAERNCMYTTTTGTGEIIKEALDFGVKRIILGIGGSATNDAGTGMASALGYTFLDIHGRRLRPIGANLRRITKIEYDGKINWDKLEITVLCDVKNPLYGKSGAAFVYAPQKGATTAQIKKLDAGLKNIAGIMKDVSGSDIARVPGAGAAGGLGAGAIFFLKGQLKPGAEFLLQETGFKEALKDCDVVVTGEGKLDSQTRYGKALSTLIKIAAKQKISIVTLCGKIDLEPGDKMLKPVTILKSITGSGISEIDAIDRAPEHLKNLASEAASELLETP